ncbi:hypothetical protein Tco_1090770 [Tanacetum coccineum]|uniref:Uncharacterized protein n=1 Tax=Tanacetum coccineum TaxID=301880 RepID=A0ABQ5I577_9ASTR
MVKWSTSFILKLSGLGGLMGGSGPLSIPRVACKDGQLSSTSIGVPKVSSTTCGLLLLDLLPLPTLVDESVFQEYILESDATANMVSVDACAKIAKAKHQLSFAKNTGSENFRTLIEIFLKHLDSLSCHIINLTAEKDLRKFSDIGACHESTTQTLSSFEEYTPPVTYPEEVENTLGTPIEVEPLNEIKLEEVGLNCNHNTPFSSREVPSFDGPEPQPLLNSPSLDVSLGDVIGPEPPIKPHSPDNSRIKVVDYLTTQTPPLPHVANSHPKGVYSYYNPGIDDPKRHYGFKPGLLGKSVSPGVDISN